MHLHLLQIPKALPPVSYWWLLATWEGKGTHIYIGVLVYIIVLYDMTWHNIT